MYANDDALMELYFQHHDEVFNWILLRYRVDRSIADNVVIATFEHVRDHWEQEPTIEWLLTIAGNCVAEVAARIKQQRELVRQIAATFGNEPGIAA
jgi:hypothetical protein